MGERTNHSQPARLKRILFWVRPVVALGLLGVLFRLVSLDSIVVHLRAARPWPLAVAFLVTFAGILVSSLKLWILIRTAYPEVSFLGVLRAYYVGTFFNNFLPTSVGGDVLKINELRSQGVPVRHGTASVVVERATGISVVLALAAVVPLVGGGLFDKLGLQPLRWVLAAIGIGFFIVLGASYALWRTKVKAFLMKSRGTVVTWVAESFYAFRDSRVALAWAFGLSVLFYALIAAGLVVAARAVGAVVSPAEAVGITPIRKLPEMLPSVGALGVREGAITYCLAHLDPTAAQAAAVALLLRLLTWIHSAIGGCVYALGGKRAGEHTSQES